MPYLSDLVNDHKAIRNESNEWKIQLDMSVNLSVTNDVIERLFKSFLTNYQNEDKILRTGSNFAFESADLFSYYIHKANLKRGKSYIKPPEWILNKRATINPKNKDNKCFQYSITVALNHQNIGNHPERISNIKPFIDQYNWEGIDFPSGIKDWKKFERNNKTIALNILYVHIIQNNKSCIQIKV